MSVISLVFKRVSRILLKIASFLRKLLVSKERSINTDPNIISRDAHSISRKDISENALKVLYRLKQADYEAYLVGGGVRDLLLGLHPKDFDIATNATPEEVAKLFRNCRLIGRRFRLAHVHFGRDIIEVATFRAPHDEGDGEGVTKNGMIVRDNVYGSLEEDAWRRDFTVNALYYNIYDFSVVDFTGGLKDIEAKTLRMIGDVDERLQEDPVRMLRAVRFAAKLGFSIEPSLSNSIEKNIHLLDGIPPARLFEEILKLFLHGHASASYVLLKKYNLLKHLFAETAASLDETADKFLSQALINTDIRIKENKPVAPAFLYAALLWPAAKHHAAKLKNEDMSLLEVYQVAGHKSLENQLKQILIPKRFGIPMREIWTMQARLAIRTGKRPLKLLQHPRFRASYDFLLLRLQSGETQLQELCDWWTRIQEVEDSEKLAMCRNVSSPGKRRRPRKKKRAKTVS